MHGNSEHQDQAQEGVPTPDSATSDQAQDSNESSGAGSETIQGPAPSGPKAEGGDETNAPQMQNHVRKLNLVGSSQITRAVAEAVRRGLSRQFVITETQLEGAVKAIGTELMQRLKANSKSVRGMPKDAFLREVRADKQRIEAEKEAARKELESLLEKLQSSHDAVDRREEELVAESRVHGQAEDKELTAKINDIFASLQAGADIEEIRDKITALALGSLQGERDKSIEAQLSDHRNEVDNFERRIAKLTHSLELTEDELKRIAAAKNIELGVGSIYRTVQGLNSSDDNYETKKELMSSIFAANLELQKGHAEAG